MIPSAGPVRPYFLHHAVFTMIRNVLLYPALYDSKFRCPLIAAAHACVGLSGARDEMETSVLLVKCFLGPSLPTLEFFLNLK